MTVHLYTVTDGRNVLEKNLGQGVEKHILFLNAQDVTSPFLKLRNFSRGWNYAYIPALGRYYYIERYTIETNEIASIYLNVDVLETYRNRIREASANIVSSEGAVDADALDYTPKNVHETLTYSLDNPFNDSSDIMITVQGA